jgi:hypothetical protein
MPAKERLMRLREIVIIQLKSLRSIDYVHSIDSPHTGSASSDIEDISPGSSIGEEQGADNR